MLFADTIKALSDRGVRATIFLIGVADSVGDLIRDHRSIERALVQIHMPRMSREELADIVNGGMEKAHMTITREACGRSPRSRRAFRTTRSSSPSSPPSRRSAERRTEVGARDVDAAVERAIERAQQSLVDAYRVATAGDRDTLYPQVLLASALADEDEYGFFGASDVSAPLERILGRPCKPVTFARHLDRLSGEARGGVLQKASGRGGCATASRTRSCSRTWP